MNRRGYWTKHAAHVVYTDVNRACERNAIKNYKSDREDEVDFAESI